MHFYLSSDNIAGKSSDRALLQAVADTLSSMGHTYEIFGVNPNYHNVIAKTRSHNENTCCFFVWGGRDVGVMEEMAGDLGTWWYNLVQANGGHVLNVYMSPPYGACDSLDTPCGRAWDANYGWALDNPAQYLTDHDILYIEASTVDELCDKVRGLSISGTNITTGNQSSIDYSGVQENKVTMGYDKGCPFNAYLVFNYFIDDDRTNMKTIYVNFSKEAPTTSYKFRDYTTMSFNNKVGAWVNDKHSVNNFNLLEKLQIANDDLGGKHTYYVTQILFEYTFPHEKGKEVTGYDDNNTEVKSWYLYDGGTDKSSYKMDLYNIGFYNGETGNSTDFDTFGESILKGLKSVLDDTTYTVVMDYKPHRNEDVMVMKNLNKNYDSKCTFVEDPYADAKYQTNEDKLYVPITKVSNIRYQPLNNLVTNYLVTFNELYDYEDKYTKYKSAVSHINLDDYMRYGDISETTNLTNTYGVYEAKYIASNKYYEENNDKTTFTISCEGLPPLEIGDTVGAEMYSKELTNLYRVCSIEIDIDPSKRPIIQPSIGLGDIDRKIKVNEQLQEQRKQLSNLSTDTSYARYVGKDEKLWD